MVSPLENRFEKAPRPARMICFQPRAPHPANFAGFAVMDTYLKISSPDVRFLADTHFRDRLLAGEDERRRAFRSFLDGLPSESALFLLGDIFDFFFEYATVVSKRYFDIFTALYNATQRGVEIHFLGGNHDYWVRDFLSEELGITLHGDEVLIDCQGRKVLCTHGDMFMPGDDNYKMIRSVIRNRFVVRAAKILHPDLMDAIAGGVSQTTRRRNHTNHLEDMAKRLADAARSRCFAKENDIFIMGHVHYPLHRIDNGREFMIVGDWIKDFTYARIKDGKLSLEKFKYEKQD